MPRTYVRRDPVARFWGNVNKNGPVHPVLGTRCWLWGDYPANGRVYGKISLRSDGKNVDVGAHRYSWELHKGPVPDGLFVLHHCDVRPCVNPAHLFVGTYSDNTKDAARKGRLWGQDRTHCPRGHEYTPDNLVGGKTGRNCKTCHRERELARVHRTPGLMDVIAQRSREWRVKNPEKARLADARGVARRRARNLARKRAAA